jgi:hypothetical protein
MKREKLNSTVLGPACFRIVIAKFWVKSTVMGATHNRGLSQPQNPTKTLTRKEDGVLH